MKTLISIAIALAAIAGLSLAFSDNASDRPPGVAAGQWAQISATLGVVLVPDSGLSAESPPSTVAPKTGLLTEGPKFPVGNVDPTVLIAPTTQAVRNIIEEGQPVRGYIMVKRGKLWRPLQVVAPTL
jgi:hypothetical protein